MSHKMRVGGGGFGLTFSHLFQAVRFNLRALTNDKTFCFFLAASAAGVGSVAVPVVRRLQAKADKEKGLFSDKMAGKSILSKNENKKKKKKKKRRENDLSPLFWKRLVKMLRIAVPSPTCETARLLLVQFSFLVLRALLTVRLSQINVRLLTDAISRASWRKWARWLINFVGWMGIGMATNSALSFIENCLRVALRRQLTLAAHTMYMRNNFFYNANVMRNNDVGSPGAGNGGSKAITLQLDNLDQRITSDIYEWCFEIVGLYGHSFKPILEFALSVTAAMKDIGAKRPIGMFSWFLLVGGIIKGISPSIGGVVSKRQAMEGEFRRVHSRLIAHAEEIAFLKGASAEEQLLNDRFDDMVTLYGGHNLKYLSKKIFDEFLKFQAPLVGGIFVHVPFLMRPQLDAARRITEFRSTETIMLKSGSAFGETMLLHKRFQKVSGFTRRIAELFEALEDSEQDATSSGNGGAAAMAEDAAKAALARRTIGDRIEFVDLTVSAPEPRRVTQPGNDVEEDDEEAKAAAKVAAAAAPDRERRLLVKQLNMSIPPGTNVMVTGPNGCGKTSLFRVLAGLWPALSGNVMAPARNVMWLPQRPYLVLGSLRDQVTYPMLHRSAGAIEAASEDGGHGPNIVPITKAEDVRIRQCLRKAGLDRFVDQAEGLELEHHEWNSVLSGGERQRLGFARLFYAQPQYAVLDESTSALNPEIEADLYSEITNGSMDVTVISIAHRMALSKYHDKRLHIVGDGSGKWTVEELPGRK